MGAKTTRRCTLVIGLAALGLVTAVLALNWAVWNVLWPRGQARAKAAATLVYESAASGYRGAKASPEALSTLRSWDADRGCPTSYRVRDVQTQILGHPSYVSMEVRRGKRTYVETTYLPDSEWVSGVSEGRK